jgi:sarcosine oxidase subunit beta
VGPVDDVDHFYQASGFMGHGFMMAPAVGKHFADFLVAPSVPALLGDWNLRRFKEGRLLREAMIIG